MLLIGICHIQRSFWLHSTIFCKWWIFLLECTVDLWPRLASQEEKVYHYMKVKTHEMTNVFIVKYIYSLKRPMPDFKQLESCFS